MARTKKKPEHKQTDIILIAALQHDRGLGNKGDLLYPIKADMDRFKEVTDGHTVVMGRKTWESIPEKFRPLKNRKNIVITRDKDYKASGATVVHKFYQALEAAPKDRKIFIIGGAQIYKQALSYANLLDLTLVDGNKEADAFFPEYESYFVEEARSKPMFDEKNNVHYTFVSFVKK